MPRMIDPDVESEIEERFRKIESEIVNKRDKSIDRWLTMIGLVAVIAGFVSFHRFRQIETDARQHVEEVKGFVEEIKGHRDEAKAYNEELKKLNAEVVSENPGEATSTATSVREDREASLIDRAVAAAVLLQQQEKTEEAIAKWRSIANILGEEDRQLQARAWFSIGYLLSGGDRANWEAKIDAYTEAIELNPANAAAYNNRGNAKRNLGQNQAAIKDYDRAIELNPAYALAYNNRGRAKRNLRQNQAAMADFNRAIELDSDRASFYNRRGYTRNELGQYRATLLDFDRAIELNRDYAFAYNNRGYAKNELGQYQAALLDIDLAIELNSDNAAAYNNRGRVRVKENLSRIPEAREDYQKALDLAQASGGEALVAGVKDNLSRLDNNEKP